MKKILKLCFVSLFVFVILGQANAGKMMLPPTITADDCSETEKPFCQAILSGDSKTAKELIIKEENNIKKEDLNMILLTASIMGDRDLAEFLIEKGAKVNSKAGDGEFLMSPLLAAIIFDNPATAKFLIEKGADVNTKTAVETDNMFITPLLFASLSGKYNIAKLLIKKGAKVNVKAGELSPLHAAVGDEGNLIMVQLLIDNHAKINAIDAKGKTPLDYAKQRDTKELLLQHGAKSGLNIAVKNNDAKHMKKILDGLDFRFPADKQKAKQALVYAAQEGKEKVVQVILDKGLDVNTHALAVDEYMDITALMSAVKGNSSKMVKFLISKGANVNEYSNVGYNPLSLAAYNGNMKMAELLVEQGADVKSKNGFDRTILHYATTKEMAQFLVSKGADINAKDRDGNTPLHHTNYEVAEFLIQQGADINAQNRFGDTPLDNYTSPSFGRDKEIKQMLLRHGAKSGKDLK